ncbi:MAG: ATP-binding protein [Bacteroidota bacterium]
MQNKKAILILLFFLIIEILFFLSIQYSHNKEINKHLQESTSRLNVKLNTINNSFFFGMAETFVSQIINRPEITKLFSKAYLATPEKKQEIRDSLYNLLIINYEYLKIQGIIQLHFHLPDNESFLRFHRPYIFGDNLTDYRYSVKMTNQNKRNYSGFEEGRIFSGFRYVFSLYHETKHIGSVETSFSFKAFELQLRQRGYKHIGFILKKNVINTKVFESEKNNYTTSILSENYMHEKKYIHYAADNQNILEQIDNKISLKIQKQLSDNKCFTIYEKLADDYYTISFISINNVKGEPVAYIFAYNKDNVVAQYKNRNMITQITGFIFIALLAFFITRVTIKNQKIKEQNENLKHASIEIKESEAKLKESNSTKDKFFSIIAHDLKSPFNAILGFTRILLENHKKYDDEKREEVIRLVNDSANNAFNLLEDLLTWSRLQSGHINFSPEKLHLKILLFETITNLQTQADKKNIQLLDTIAEDDMIFADKNMIATVFRNLLSNAIKFTNNNGSVTISSKKQTNSNFLEISIKDTGVGIPKDKIQDLFRIDKDISTQGTEKETGTGLGLTLCKEFIENHKGEIWVESEIEKGTIFYFTIPKTS